MRRAFFLSSLPFFFAADSGGASAGSGKPLKEQLADSQAEVNRLTTENANLLKERDQAASEKAGAEKARDLALGEKMNAETQREEALQAKQKAEDAKATAETEKANAQREAELAKTKAREDAAKAGITAPPHDGAKQQGNKDSGDDSAKSPRERLASIFKTA